MGNELERRATPDIEESFRVAKGFAMSGYFADAKSAEQAFVKIMAGAEMGLAPFQSMTGIAVIQGKPVVGAGLLAAMLDQHPDYSYEVEWEPDQATATACTVVIFKGGKERGRSRFSLEDAQRAGLANKDNWKKFPTAMLIARAMSQGVRWYAPGLAGQSVYVEGELDHQPTVRTSAVQAEPADVLIDMARDMLDATEIIDADDLPFEDAAPATPEAESRLATGQLAAEPAAPPPAGGGLLIDSVDAAARVIRAMTPEQLKALKALLEIEGTTTKTALAARLYDHRADWYAADVLEEIA